MFLFFQLIFNLFIILFWLPKSCKLKIEGNISNLDRTFFICYNILSLFIP